MKVKDETVDVWGLQEEMRPVLKYAGEIWDEYGEELVITSARDGIHSAGSLHYYGYAVDLRTRYFPENIRAEVMQELEDTLKSIDHRYQVIRHSTHCHVEFDKGFWWAV